MHPVDHPLRESHGTTLRLSHLPYTLSQPGFATYSSPRTFTTGAEARAPERRIVARGPQRHVWTGRYE